MLRKMKRKEIKALDALMWSSSTEIQTVKGPRFRKWAVPSKGVLKMLKEHEHLLRDVGLVKGIVNESPVIYWWSQDGNYTYPHLPVKAKKEPVKIPQFRSVMELAIEGLDPTNKLLMELQSAKDNFAALQRQFDELRRILEELRRIHEESKRK